MPNFYKNNYYIAKKNPQIMYQNTRTSHVSQQHPTNITNIPPPPPCKTPKKKKAPPKKKFNFKSLKKDTCTSLNDVECFLNKFSNFIKYVKLINLLK